MTPQQRYILEDFLNFAQTNFPTEYAPLADITTYRFEDKTCLKDNQQAKEATLLFIGRYYFPLTWRHLRLGARKLLGHHLLLRQASERMQSSYHDNTKPASTTTSHTASCSAPGARIGTCAILRRW